MMLAVSNLAIPPDAAVTDLGYLKSLGVDGLEIAPTRIAPWDALTPKTLGEYRSQLNDLGLQIPSLQALLFGTTGLHLLQDETQFAAMVEHLRHVSRIGVTLGATIGVFGSPRNRNRGCLTDQAAWDLGRLRFDILAKAVAGEGFSLGLEPVPATYGGDFLPLADDVIRMVTEIDHPGLRVHLDTGCVALGNGLIECAIKAAGPNLGHFHIAEADLGPFDAPKFGHAKAATALLETGYSRWIAIEMREQATNPFQAIQQAVGFVNRTYRAEANK